MQKEKTKLQEEQFIPVMDRMGPKYEKMSPGLTKKYTDKEE